MKKMHLRRVLLCFAIGGAAVLALALLFWFRLPEEKNTQDLFQVLADSFFVPGVLLCGVAGISWASREGAFDMLAYGTKSFVGVVFRSYGKKLPKTYYDYREQQRAKEKEWLREALLAGAILLGTGLLLLIPYYAIPAPAGT